LLPIGNDSGLAPVAPRSSPKSDFLDLRAGFPSANNPTGQD